MAPEPGAGSFEKSSTTPARAAFPHAAAPPPGTISAPDRESTGTRLHGTQPPKGSFRGTPSRRTSERLAPLGPSPLRETPCEVGFAVMLSLRRKRLKSAASPRTPSTAGDAGRSNASAGMIPTPNGTSETGSGERVALTDTGSSVWTWAEASARRARDRNARRGRTAGS